MALSFHNKNYNNQYSRKTESHGVSAIFGGSTMDNPKT